jgi:hypothetical protein
MKTDQANVTRPMLCIEHSIDRSTTPGTLRACMLVSSGDCEVCTACETLSQVDPPVRYPSVVS